jgi:hypothetical protein
MGCFQCSQVSEIYRVFRIDRTLAQVANIRIGVNKEAAPSGDSYSPEVENMRTRSLEPVAIFRGLVWAGVLSLLLWLCALLLLL